MWKTAGETERRAEGWCRAAQDGGGRENDSSGGLEEKCSVFFFLLKVG